MVDDKEKVDSNIETICCDGGQDGLGHPAVSVSYTHLTLPTKRIV